ncbi:GGDEF domain-containing protein [Inhella proteolytica]|uniref:diguanylate cyclase n=1 Tax=Inhella proteolytica TaxID=2795029 RepID=A0A931J3A1_9BURK|nr:GGDEF domain-containing protein [Inhella proteolytica]MBH9578766.1 GGDEF domain-containing protein [Inhella proteolytica]
MRRAWLLLLWSAWAGGAAAQQGLQRLEARERLAPPAFQSLIAELDAQGRGQDALRAHALQCRLSLGQDAKELTALVEAGLRRAIRLPAPEPWRAGLLNCQGYLAQESGDLRKALQAFETALAHGGPQQRADAQAFRGELFYLRGHLHAALTDLRAAHAGYVQQGDAPMQRYGLTLLANLYADERIAEYGRALEIYRGQLASHEAAGRAGDAATALFNIGSTLRRAGQLEEAHSQLRTALERYEALGDADSVAETRRTLGSLLVSKGDAAAALPLLEAALTHWRQQASSSTELANARFTRAKALWRLGRLTEADADLEAAGRWFVAEKMPRFLEPLLAERAELEAARGRWEAAFRARSRQLALARELETLRRDELSAGLRVQFDTERKERENAALQRENSLRGAALEDAARIRKLQAALLVCALLLALGLGVLGWRAHGRARHMKKLAHTDVLTGVPNRRAILERLDQALAAGQALPVLMFDIDHFKAINDGLGHDAGDEVLRTVARAVQEELGAAGALGRIGGEEFLVLLDPQAGRAGLAEWAERLRHTVAMLRFAGEAAALARVTISLGGDLARAADTSPEALLKRVDEALYRAKQGGRNRVELVDQ